MQHYILTIVIIENNITLFCIIKKEKAPKDSFLPPNQVLSQI